MKISIIVAISANNVIGINGGLPWHLPEDLKRFREVTMGKPIIMGRVTFESIGRPLPGRENVVLTRESGYVAEGCTVVGTIEAAVELASEAEEIMVIGGGEIYRQFLAITDQIYLTRVQAEIKGDTTFPEIDMSEWKEVSHEEYQSEGGSELSFEMKTLVRC